MGWVVLPPSKIYQCSSLLIIFSLATLQRGDHGYSELKTHLASRSPSRRPRSVPGAPAAPTLRLPKNPGVGRGDEPRGRAGVAGPQLKPNSAAKGQHHPPVRPPERSWDRHPSAGAASTVPATARLLKTRRPPLGWAACFLCCPLSGFPVFCSLG